ncbi:MAG: ligase-associated DNA damage response endonuclease PdeM [Pseudomonadota bacterium]
MSTPMHPERHPEWRPAAGSVPSPLVLQAGTDRPEATLWLLPERALWWPAGATLFVADVHLGKAAAFRAAGLPVPGGTTQDNLQRLGALLTRHRAQRLVVLGDWLHARSGRTAAVLDALLAWRQAHAGLACVLVRGNHDGRAGDPPRVLEMTVVDEPWPCGPWQCRHAPPPPDDPPGAHERAEGIALCGHVHPVCVLHGPARERLRLPCFVLTRQALWLPAFGAFTGGHAVPAAPGRVRCAVLDDAVCPIERPPPQPWRIVPPG